MKKNFEKAVAGVMLASILIGGNGLQVKAGSKTTTWKEGRMEYEYNVRTADATKKVKEFSGTRFHWKCNASEVQVTTEKSETKTFTASIEIGGEKEWPIVKLNASLGFQYENSSTQTVGVAYTLTKSDPKGTYCIAAECPGKKVSTKLVAKNTKTGKKTSVCKSTPFAPTTNAIQKTLNYSAK